MAPTDRLVEIARRYPGAWAEVDRLRDLRGQGLPLWPGHCYLPIAGGVAIASEGVDARVPLVAQDAAALVGLAAWRVTQGVYRFDAELLDALWRTPVRGDLPVELLHRLPEWCVYVETAGRSAEGLGALAGAWAWIEWDPNDGREELRLLLDPEDGGPLLPVPIHLHGGGLEQSLWAATAEATRQARFLGAEVGDALVGAARELAQAVEPLVALVLYLCSEAPDVSGAWPPARPEPKRTKRGARIFPAQAPRVWPVGERIGAALRQAREAAPEGQGGTHASPRPHVRAAHWHTYWTGPRRTTPVLRWIAPILVGADAPGAD